MKKSFLLIIIIFITSLLFGKETPFSKGVNLTNWFQVNSPTEIQFTKYTKADFENIKSLGTDVIRLPINLHSMTLGAPDYELDPLFLRFLDEVVSWAEELEIHLLLDNHTFDPTVSTDPSVENILVPVWQNMADHFKSRSKYVYYEILNEPHGIDDTAWNRIQQNVIDAIREIDTVHTIVVGPAGWNSYNNLKHMPAYEDDNLIYTFHFYDPFLFTHQGASWTDPSLVPLSGVPFPFDSGEMPSVPSELQSTWIESSLNNYQNEGTISRVRELIDIAAQFKDERDVPIFCGEFGVYIPNSNNSDRILWYNIVRTYFEYKGIAWTTWDYHGGFGLFESTGYGLFDYDLNTNLLSALGFIVPTQSEYDLKPDSTGFGIFSDFIESNIISSSNSDGLLNFYNTNAYDDEYCISWANTSQYNNIGFKFYPVKDLSYLVNNNYYLSFWVKSDNPNTKFDIRFIDTKENSEDHPWRMGKTINSSNAVFDGEWHQLQIPLSSLVELGSWDNAWYNPQGLFDWKAVDRLEIVDEHGVLSSTQLWFDDIKIYDPFSTSVEKDLLVNTYELYQNYPNPFNPTTTIKFSLPVSSNVRIVIYNSLGEKVKELLDDIRPAGNYELKFDGSNLSSGVYFYQLITENYISINKMMLVK